MKIEEQTLKEWYEEAEKLYGKSKELDAIGLRMDYWEL